MVSHQHCMPGSAGQDRPLAWWELACSRCKKCLISIVSPDIRGVAEADCRRPGVWGHQGAWGVAPRPLPIVSSTGPAHIPRFRVQHSSAVCFREAAGPSVTFTVRRNCRIVMAGISIVSFSKRYSECGVVFYPCGSCLGLGLRSMRSHCQCKGTCLNSFLVAGV